MRIDESSASYNALPIGLAKLTRLAFSGVDLEHVAKRLLGMFERDPEYAGALMDLAIIDQLCGDPALGLKRQAIALSKQRVFHSTCCGANPRLRVLAFVAGADIGANTPLEFLLEGSDIALTMVYVLPGRPLPNELPPHDLAFVAIAGHSANRRILVELEEHLAVWSAPVVNLPERIAMLERAGLAVDLSAIDGLSAPLTKRALRHEMSTARDAAPSLWRYPIVIKPEDSRQRHCLEKIDSAAELDRYLSRRPEPSFVVSPFINCRGQDGLFRKIRLVFIDRLPYACHLAVSEGWNTPYFDARMDADGPRRSEEARFFASFDEDFVARHHSKLAALADRVGLAYFGVDCAETQNGELVVFDVDHTLLVHDMDPVELFPYKPPQMRKIFDAFAAFLYRVAHKHH